MTEPTKPAATTKALTPIEAFRNDLSRMGPQFKMALPPHIVPDKFIRVVVTAVQGNADLLNVDRGSLFGACMKAAQDGLLPDGREGAIIKFRTKEGDKAQWMPMVGGILKKVRNSGELSSISANVVYKNDQFDYFIDESGEHLTHKPKLDGERGPIHLTYAVAKTKDGGVYVEVMTEDQMTAVKGMSRAKDSGPWSGPFADEMRKKTAIRRLSKRLPMSTDLDDVIRADDELYDLKHDEPKAPEQTPKASRVHKIIEAQIANPPTKEQAVAKPAVGKPAVAQDAPPDSVLDDAAQVEAPI